MIPLRIAKEAITFRIALQIRFSSALAALRLLILGENKMNFFCSPADADAEFARG